MEFNLVNNKNNNMKVYISIITICLLLSCNTEKESLQNSQEYYADLLNKKLIENGIKNTEYFTVGFENINVEGLSHDEIIANINEAIPILKEKYEESLITMKNTLKADASKKMFGDVITTEALNLLIKTVKQNSLDSEEPFYQKLFALKLKKDQVTLYVAELDLFKRKMVEASDKGDLGLVAKIQEKYSYLFVDARATNGTKVSLDLINDKNRSSMRYVIRKYDPIRIEMLKNVKEL